MKIDLLLKELDALNLPSDQYAISASGPLAVRGLREANDLDVIVTEKLWKELALKYPVNKNGIHLANIEIMWEGSIEPGSIFTEHIDKQISTADLIDGHRYVNLELVRKFKKALGREKDKNDIVLIDQYLKDHPQ